MSAILCIELYNCDEGCRWPFCTFCCFTGSSSTEFTEGEAIARSTSSQLMMMHITECNDKLIYKFMIRFTRNYHYALLKIYTHT